MSIEALWSMEFTGYAGNRVQKSGGVVIVESGRIFGGDTWMWYVGNYERKDGGRYAVRMQTGVHHTDGGQSIFGTALQAMVLVGEFRVADDQRTATATMTVEGAPAILTAVLTRQASLP